MQGGSLPYHRLRGTSTTLISAVEVISAFLCSCSVLENIKRVVDASRWLWLVQEAASTQAEKSSLYLLLSRLRQRGPTQLPTYPSSRLQQPITRPTK